MNHSFSSPITLTNSHTRIVATIGILVISVFVFMTHSFVLAQSGTPQTGPFFTVTDTADTNGGTCTDTDCSLREAIIAANAYSGAGTPSVFIPSGTYTLSITGVAEDSGATGDLDITRAMDIVGDAPETTIIDANQIDRIFDIHSVSASDLNEQVNINGVRVINGSVADDGGGVRIFDTIFAFSDFEVLDSFAGANGGGLYIDNAALETAAQASPDADASSFIGTLQGNSAPSQYGGNLFINTFADDMGLPGFIFEGTADSGFAEHGAGMYIEAGSINLVKSAITRNTANRLGGGLYLDSLADVRLDNTIVGENSAGRHGGASYLQFQSELYLSFSTIENNIAYSGASGFYGIGTFTAESSLFYRNAGLCDLSDDNGATLVGHNAVVSQSATRCFFNGDTDKLTLQYVSHLLPLDNYGGSTESYEIYPYSAIIDVIPFDECTAITDIRGVSRDQGTGCEIGAVEFVPTTPPSDLQTGPTFTVNTESDEGYSPTNRDYFCTESHCTLREAILASNANPGADTIILPPGTYENTAGGNVSYNSFNGDDDFGAVGDFDITDDLTIVGAGADVTFVDGIDRSRVIFDIRPADPAINVTIQDITVQNGWYGVQASYAYATLDTVHLTQNFIGAYSNMFVDIREPEPFGLLIRNSAITHNLMGLYFNGHKNEVVNSTVSSNGLYENFDDRPNGYGYGAIRSDEGGILRNVTVYNNQTQLGSVSGSYSIFNTVIYGNYGDRDRDITDCGYVERGFNSANNYMRSDVCRRSAERTGPDPYFDTSIFGGPDPLFGPLQLNGGTVPSHMPLPGSPLIGAGNNSAFGETYACEPVDQYGNPREQLACTIGAVQVDYPPYIQDVLTDAALADQRLTDGEQVDVPITTFTLPFSRVMAEIGAGSVTNASNYALVNAGADGIIDTTTCVNPAGDDSFVAIDSIDYDTMSRVANVVVNGGVGLSVGTYQLRVCSTMTDAFGTALDGNVDGISGDDFELEFEVFPQQSGADLVVNNYTTEFDGYCGVLHCTLPDAVAVANAQAGVNTITFDYENPLTGRNIGASNNVLSFAITDDLTIQGVPGVGVYANYSVASGVSFTLRDLLLGTYSSVSNDSGGTFTATNITRNSNLGRFLSNAGTAYIYDSIIGGNAVTEGGVIYNTGTLTLDNAYIVDGDVRERGAGIYNTGSLTIANSTFRNNEVSDGRGNSDAGGGAIYTANGTVDIRNTTFTQNEGGIGAAIRVDSGDVTLNNVTLIDNTSNDDPYSDHIYVMPAGTLTIQNSILVGGNVQLEGSDCQGAVTSLGHNIIGEIGDDCTLNLQLSDILLSDYPSLKGDPLLGAMDTSYNDGLAPVAPPCRVVQPMMGVIRQRVNPLTNTAIRARKAYVILGHTR